MIFKHGQKVRCIKPIGDLELMALYTVDTCDTKLNDMFVVFLVETMQDKCGYYAYRFKIEQQIDKYALFEQMMQNEL